MSKGIGRLLADDTTAQVSGEILAEPINNKEMELYKDREKGKAVRTFTLTGPRFMNFHRSIQRFNSKEGRPVVWQPGDHTSSFLLFQLLQPQFPDLFFARPAATVCCSNRVSVQFHRREDGWIQSTVDL